MCAIESTRAFHLNESFPSSFFSFRLLCLGVVRHQFGFVKSPLMLWLQLCVPVNGSNDINNKFWWQKFSRILEGKVVMINVIRDWNDEAVKNGYQKPKSLLHLMKNGRISKLLTCYPHTTHTRIAHKKNNAVRLFIRVCGKGKRKQLKKQTFEFRWKETKSK